jgi:K+-sensing histidine kinase KdpD
MCSRFLASLPVDGKICTGKNLLMKKVLHQGKPVAGVLLCLAAALLTASVSSQHAWRVFVPFAFVAVVVLLSARYGLAVSIVGSLGAALVFAYAFAPVGSWRVADPVERNSIAWMLLGSIALSYLLVPPQPHGK